MASLLTAWNVISENRGVMGDFETFSFFQTLYPTKETAELAADTVGHISETGIYAAMTAAICRRVGKVIDPQSDLAREIVAYSFECREDKVIEELMASALNGMRPKQVRRDYSRAPISFR